MSRFFNHRLLALIQKEFNQIRRDPNIVVSLIVPPIVQILLFGFVLNSKIENLRLGVIDQSRTPESRELIADLGESGSFRLARSYLAPDQLSSAIADGSVQAGIIVPYDFTRNLQRGGASRSAVSSQCYGCQYGNDCPELCTRRRRSLFG